VNAICYTLSNLSLTIFSLSEHSNLARYVGPAGASLRQQALLQISISTAASERTSKPHLPPNFLFVAFIAPTCHNACNGSSCCACIEVWSNWSAPRATQRRWISCPAVIAAVVGLLVPVVCALIVLMMARFCTCVSPNLFCLWNAWNANIWNVTDRLSKRSTRYNTQKKLTVFSKKINAFLMFSLLTSEPRPGLWGRSSNSRLWLQLQASPYFGSSPRMS